MTKHLLMNGGDLMSVESAADRHRKRIVEHVISGFNTAHSAIRFGNTIESMVNDKIGEQKFRQYIGSPDTVLAITDSYDGKTVLKTTFLELQGDDMAHFVCSALRTALGRHNNAYKASLKIANETIRGKPQPQFVG